MGWWAEALNVVVYLPMQKRLIQPQAAFQSVEGTLRWWQRELSRLINLRMLNLPHSAVWLRTCYGQADHAGHCCSFEREPGSDDEMPVVRG